MSDQTNANDMMKLFITAAVTVAGSYMSITSHIDKSVSDHVDEAIRPVLMRVDAVKYYADSLHRLQAVDISALTDRQPNRKR